MAVNNHHMSIKFRQQNNKLQKLLSRVKFIKRECNLLRRKITNKKHEMKLLLKKNKQLERELKESHQVVIDLLNEEPFHSTESDFE